jgi:deoxycytidine triphosphate deaminase
MLNAEQILEQGLIKVTNSKGKPAQVGYDLSAKSINRIGLPSDQESFINNRLRDLGVVTSKPNIGMVLKDNNILNNYSPVKTTKIDGVEGWLLYPGAYDVTFHEGCKIAANKVGMIRQRSSLLRNGAIIASSIFDPGFETENMGTIMIVTATIFIEQDARVGQMYFHKCDSVAEDNLYQGQFQNDKQR